RIVSGNSLLGATPELIAAGVPDAAYKTLLGDETAVVRAHKARNKQEQGQLVIEHFTDSLAGDEADLAAKAEVIDSTPDGSLKDIRLQEQRHQHLVASAAYERQRCAADAWCAAFVAPRGDDAIPVTQDLIVRAATAGPSGLGGDERELVARLADTHRFFHWHVAFPEVASAGGFDAVVGNPPWERIKLQEKEWFATRNPAIATAKTKAAREKLIEKLPESDPPLWDRWQEAKRAAEAASHFIRNGGRYPLCGRGDVNTYSIFAEGMRTMIGPHGRVGVIVPTGIATDDTTKYFFRDLVDARSLVSLLSFAEVRRVFIGTDDRSGFCLLTLTSPSPTVADPRFLFGAETTADLADAWRRFTLSPDDIALLNPNSGTCPTFLSAADAEVSKRIYRAVPPLVREGDANGNPWNVRFRAMFHMANDSIRFSDDPEGRLRLYEGKMIWHFDHRFGTYEGQTQAQANMGTLPRVTEAQHRDPRFISEPRHWLLPVDVENAASDQPGWLIAFRDLARSVDLRTATFAA
ncbi:MAG: Eco57I restriction-modification methylase domain-containing protein, partial [Pseudonocardiaceae bacterium]